MKKFRAMIAVLLAFVLVAAAAASCNKIEVPNNSESNPSSTPTTTPGGDNPTTTPSGGEEEDPTAINHVYTNPNLPYAEGTELRMAVGYNSKQTGLLFDADIAGDGITLADGVTYHTGDLKPTWAEMQNRLHIKFDGSMYSGGKASDEFKNWVNELGKVDMVSGTVTQLSENGVAGKLVNIAEYLDKMPNFKAYLEANPIVRMAIVSDTDTGAIYVSPYFDGVSDIERMPLMRVDWVVKLLDGEGKFTASASGTTATPAWTPYMPTSGKYEIDVVKPDGTGVEQVTKDYDAAGNIIEKMNAAGPMSGVDAVNMLRDYIDTAYAGYYGTTRSNLFCGQNAAWDADELVALLRCVVANAQTLNGTDTVGGIMCRENSNNNRRIDMFRFAGTLLGVRGLESRKDYLYVGSDGAMHDARLEADTYEAMERMNTLVKEGLVAEDFVNKADPQAKELLEKDSAFMHYDYNQTQTIYNKTVLQEGEKYMAVMVPVARWDDGTGEKLMRFTESWRSVKTDGWGISVDGINGDQDKLNAALALIDYAYTKDGQILLSYGPDAFVKMTDENHYEMFDFNGEQWPVISDASYEDLWEFTNGNYTDYARKYIGSTLSFLKSQSFEYQCTHEVGKEGAGYISRAIALGTIKHPENAITDNRWYTNVPTQLPLTEQENSLAKSYTELNDNFSQEKGGENILIQQIVSGYTDSARTSAEKSVDTVLNSWSGKQWLAIQQTGWERALEYYNTIQ